MNKTKLLTFLVSLFLVVLLSFLIYFSLGKPRILVVQSYNTDYSWTANVDVGIRRTLLKHPYNNIRFHYMDTKNHPEPEFKEKAGIFARSVVDSFEPDVLIAVDDDAQEYCAKYYTNHPHTRIVHAGINGSPAVYGYLKATNTTGILERKPLKGVQDAIQIIGQMNGQGPSAPLRLMVLGDKSGSVKDDCELIRHFDWAPLVLVGVTNLGDFDGWKEQVRACEGRADFLLLINYRKIKRSKSNESMVPAKEVVKWTLDNSKVAGISLNGFGVDDDGYMFAVGTSPYEQGEVAAQMAVQIIEKKIPPAKIPMASTQQFTVHVRKKLFEKYGLRLPKVFEAFARVGNSYYDE